MNSQTETKVRFKTRLLHAAVHLCLFYHLRIESTRSCLMLLQPILLHSPHHTMACRIYIYHQVLWLTSRAKLDCLQTRDRKSWLVIVSLQCGVTVKVLSVKYGSLLTSSGSNGSCRCMYSPSLKLCHLFIYLFLVN